MTHEVTPVAGDSALSAVTVPEILAPAGGREQFFAALNAGADAVFLGLKQFNARARAENFTLDDLKSLVPLAHRYGMKVLVTLNVLVKDGELDDLVTTLAGLDEVGVDALIVQDLAVASLARRFFPGLRLHASTQMAVHNVHGVRQLAEWGFRRVVVARELTFQELKRIRAAIPRADVEIEAFCHGSLCYSYSGLCFFSGANDARSGNRGECAYTCREPYRIVSEPGHGFLFSMKDLDTAQDVDQFARAGVDTIKIEGRKKDAQYVTSVVRLYRKMLDESLGFPTLRPEAPQAARDLAAEEAALRADLALSFQRQPTSFFLKGRYHENVIDLNNPSHAGVPLGTVEAVRAGRALVTLKEPLERFDGVKLVAAAKVFHARPTDGERVTTSVEDLRRKYANETPQFSVRDLYVKNRWIPSAQAGARVEIALPDGVDAAVGDALFRVRSNDLKRRVEEASRPPDAERLRPVFPVDVQAEATRQGDQAHVRVSVARDGVTLAQADLTVPAAESRSGPLSATVRDLFGIFGQEGFTARAVTFTGDDSLFVPASRLKELKRQLGAALPAAWDAETNRRAEAARAYVADLGRGAPADAVETGRSALALKADRLETLDHLLACRGLGADDGALPWRELIFEPKRAFLPSLDVQAWLPALMAKADALGLPLRLAVPTVVRAWDEPLLARWFQAAHAAGVRRFEIGNVGGRALLAAWGIDGGAADVSADFTLYALNRVASAAWAEWGLSRVCLSVEDDAPNLASHLAAVAGAGRVRPEAILYKDTPLFMAEACSLTALHNGCPTAKVCGYRTLEIENASGQRFLVAHESCKSVVYGQEAYAIGEARAALEAQGVRHFRVDFLTRPYDADMVRAVLEAVSQGRRVPGTHSANYHSRLL